MEKQIEKLADEFRERYGSTPRFFQAPGRVNLIGEHTDYNEGFVMPFAIDRCTLVAASPRTDTLVNAFALDLDETTSIDLGDPPVHRRGNWIDYVEGSVRCVAERFASQLRGADVIITSTVPIGAGLSSSAALEVSIGHAFLTLNDIPIDRRELALAGQRAEHEFVGTRSGIMDQFTAVFGRKGNAMLLDCRSLEIDHISIESDATDLIAIDTKVKHNLASSEYNTRREECERGVAKMQELGAGISSLRDVTIEMLDEYADELPETIRRRCRHVVSENARTLEAAEAFRVKDLKRAGRLMSESHVSLRDDYEVSCAELDFLVEVVLAANGAYGARMTGGGFGGCTISLVERSATAQVKETVIREYSKQFGSEPDVYIFQASDGASEVVR